MSKYESLYDKKYSKCPRCHGKGKVRSKITYKEDRYYQYDRSDNESGNYKGNYHYECVICKGRGYVYDPDKTYLHGKAPTKKPGFRDRPKHDVRRPLMPVRSKKRQLRHRYGKT